MNQDPWSHLSCISIDSDDAHVAARGQWALTDDEQREVLGRLRACGIASFIVVTCNRTELYAGTSDTDLLVSILVDVRAREAGVSIAPLRRTVGLDAARRLFEVACGVRSMVPGDSEILGQLREAAMRSAAYMNPILDRLVRSARHTGRRARTETAISRGLSSVSAAACHIVHVQRPQARRIIVVGAGRTARSMVANIRASMLNAVCVVVNRTFERATELAGDFTCMARSWQELPGLLASADVVLCAIHAPEPVVNAALCPKASLVVDVSMPRVTFGAGPSVVTLDDLSHITAACRNQRQTSIGDVQRIIDDELLELERWMIARSIQPMIAEISSMLCDVSPELATESSQQGLRRRLYAYLDQHGRQTVHHLGIIRDVLAADKGRR
jgi:glutamyl-tRNA reductase